MCTGEVRRELQHPWPRPSLPVPAVISSLQRLFFCRCSELAGGEAACRPISCDSMQLARQLVDDLLQLCAQVERGASGRQREVFCTREHSREHGSGSASGHAGQGAGGAPFASALLVPWRSRFAQLWRSANRDAKKFKRADKHLLRLGHAATKCLLRASSKLRRRN